MHGIYPALSTWRGVRTCDQINPENRPVKTFTFAAMACAAVMLSPASALAAGDAAAGQAKAESCAMCHGDDGKGDEKSPGIAGMAEADFAKAIKEYQDGTREHKMMAKAAKKLSDEDVADLAAYYASL